MSDHWEEVDWDREALERANVSPVTWLLDGKVGRIEPTLGGGSSQQAKHHVVGDRSRAQPAFVVPMHGGIWTMCVSLTDEEIELLGRVGFPQERCINYLTPDEAHEEMRAAWQNRMQNLSISCSLVCLIILGAAVFVGFFGLCRHQISAVLVTGVMYLLAGRYRIVGRATRTFSTALWLAALDRCARNGRALAPVRPRFLSPPPRRLDEWDNRVCLCCSHLRAVHADDNPLQALAGPREQPGDPGRAGGRRGGRHGRPAAAQGAPLRQLLEHGLRLERRDAVGAGLARLDPAQQDHALQPYLGHDRVAARGLRGLR
ncbi:uncharacterized protein LOC131667272 isoform X1 [Phymastichus coffea]|uniref:uncharacterized protein LOC131667272 isoform X1 n=1 Tax=Phymastichus coffea TaxID=108790 RepID=UPI00273B1D14|nr:uncharacterized protein LOC131667272 isoform X1 [Phymastichus coffea]